MSIRGKIIFITSNEPWGDIWYSKQNYAYELSRTNTVYFVDPPTKKSLFNWFNLTFRTKSITENLTVIQYEHILPYLNNTFNLLNNKLISSRFKHWIEEQGISDFIFWSFDPIRLYNPKLLGAKVSIFHCVDYFYFKHLGERELCQNSDLLFATSQLFLDNYSEFDKPKHVVPHGISEDEFELETSLGGEHQLEIKDFGLYIGVIDHRMDFELYEKLIIEYTKVPFVFVGPVRPQKNEAFKRVFEEKKYPNVHLLGPKHFKTLKYYIAQASFCLSLMDMNFHMNTVHHHKTLVYLCQGKPVFSFIFEEYKHLDGIMNLSNSHEGILNKLGDYLRSGEAESLAADRIAYAQKFTFQNIINSAGRIIEEFQK
ncbi:MAG: hypothetical protein ABJF04_14575 [Reichenbachiella sp.]|uniref:hypothetical protein n=2 Tax=Reichenbachiella sp. TaxID=2184521 RepID=UPI003265E64A